MKDRITAAALGLFFLGCTSAFAQAAIKFDKTSHNFGTFKEEAPQTHVFKFTNTGNEPLVIQQVFTSCGCVARDYTKEPVAPGKAGEVKITYDGKNKMPGKFSKVITVRTNAKPNVTRLYIEGTMTVDD